MKCTLLKNIRRQYYPTIFVPSKREGHAGAKNVAYIFGLHYSAVVLVSDTADNNIIKLNWLLI